MSHRCVQKNLVVITMVTSAKSELDGMLHVTSPWQLQLPLGTHIWWTFDHQQLLSSLLFWQTLTSGLTLFYQYKKRLDWTDSAIKIFHWQFNICIWHDSVSVTDLWWISSKLSKNNMWTCYKRAACEASMDKQSKYQVNKDKKWLIDWSVWRKLQIMQSHHCVYCAA